MKQIATNRMKSALSNQSGAVLLMLLVVVTLVGLLTGIAGSSWQTIVQRSKEEDLLWKGGQIRKAIGHYYDAVQKTGKALKQVSAGIDGSVAGPTLSGNDPPFASFLS